MGSGSLWEFQLQNCRLQPGPRHTWGKSHTSLGLSFFTYKMRRMVELTCARELACSRHLINVLSLPVSHLVKGRDSQGPGYWRWAARLRSCPQEGRAGLCSSLACAGPAWAHGALAAAWEVPGKEDRVRGVQTPVSTSATPIPGRTPANPPLKPCMAPGRPGVLRVLASGCPTPQQRWHRPAVALCDARCFLDMGAGLGPTLMGALGLVRMRREPPSWLGSCSPETPALLPTWGKWEGQGMGSGWPEKAPGAWEVTLGSRSSQARGLAMTRVTVTGRVLAARTA